jgi:hypothetical protein
VLEEMLQPLDEAISRLQEEALTGPSRELSLAITKTREARNHLVEGLTLDGRFVLTRADGTGPPLPSPQPDLDRLYDALYKKDLETNPQHYEQPATLDEAPGTSQAQFNAQKVAAQPTPPDDRAPAGEEAGAADLAGGQGPSASDQAEAADADTGAAKDQAERTAPAGEEVAS